MTRALRGARTISRVGRSALALVRNPPYAPTGHFSSPSTTRGDVERAISRRAAASCPAIDLRADAQLELVRQLAPHWADLPIGATPRWRYRSGNRMFDLADAAVYASVLAHFRPRRVVEVGSGHSSAIALDTAERGGLEIDFTFIEPDPRRLSSLLTAEDRARTRLVRSPVQDVPLSRFERLADGDLLFIDSSHVVKAGSDVGWLVLEVLPRLASGVLVHLHDVFWPFEYPASWLRERRDWTEDYLLHAFLAHNDAFEIVLFASWLWGTQPELVGRLLPAAAAQEPGSIWLRKV